MQDVSRVAGYGAAVPVVEMAAETITLQLCIADYRFLAVDGFTRIMHTTMWERAHVCTEQEMGQKKKGENNTIRVTT